MAGDVVVFEVGRGKEQGVQQHASECKPAETRAPCEHHPGPMMPQRREKTKPMRYPTSWALTWESDSTP